MILPVPLPPTAEPEHLVIVEIIDGYADTTTVHQPATYSTIDKGVRFDQYEFSPASWPSRCGQVKSGRVYVLAGPFEKAQACLACEEAP